MDSLKKKSAAFEISDEKDNVPDHVHINFLENVRQIHGKPKITPATRTESAAQVSEFNISSKKKTKSGKSTFREADLIRSIRKKKPKIAQKLEAAKKTKTLSKPLETVYEKKAQREVAYQNIKKRLNAWNDVVTTNRLADQLKFPLKSKQIEIYDHADGDLFSSFTNLTPLEQEFQKVLKSSETSKEEEKKLEHSKFRLTLKEMMEKRKTFAKVKAQASYQIAKSRRQNKIKSKKYHRILRREKTKQQLKDFELLQKTDPEAALKQLEQLEKSRAEERATLRHRNTGKWARNQLVKAKYDKESRQAISEQLAKNRELTEKKLVANSDSDSGEDEGPTDVPVANSNNPWLVNSNEYTQFVSSYKKWEESENQLEDISKHNDESSKEADKVPLTQNNAGDTYECEAQVPSASSLSKAKRIREADKRKSTFQVPVKSMNEGCAEIRNNSGVWTVTRISNSERSSAEKEGSTNGRCTEMRNSSGGWTVTRILYLKGLSTEKGISEKSDVSEMFNSLEEKLEKKLKGKLKEVQDADVTTVQNKRTKRRRKKTNKKKSVKEDVLLAEQKKTEVDEDSTPKPSETFLKNEIPDLMTHGDEALDDVERDAENEYRMTISEAFADDDVVAEFREEKQKAEEKDKPQIIDTSLPGWGTWTDASSVRGKETKKFKHRRTNKRLLFKIPKAPPRKDANKGFVITKEGISDKFKEHMVNELPYPFTKVKDFEAHIRAPIGRTWLPETAHQHLIAPPIVTKLGTVIEPMDEGELVQREDFSTKH